MLRKSTTITGFLTNVAVIFRKHFTRFPRLAPTSDTKCLLEKLDGRNRSPVNTVVAEPVCTKEPNNVAITFKNPIRPQTQRELSLVPQQSDSHLSP